MYLRIHIIYTYKDYWIIDGANDLSHELSVLALLNKAGLHGHECITLLTLLFIYLLMGLGL